MTVAERARTRLLAIPDADLVLIEAADWGAPSADILARLIAEIPWKQESIMLFGKTHLQPRLVCWMGDRGCAYAYSGKRHQPSHWHPLVADLRRRVEALTGSRFNSVLLNLYRDGADSMGWHADDEPELGPRPVIASLSFGAERMFHLRHRRDRTISTRHVALVDGSLLVMRGDTQANWHHAVPKTRRPVGVRMNLTFRTVVPHSAGDDPGVAA